MTRVLLACALLCGLFTALAAGESRQTQFTTASWSGRDGLPSSYVLCLAEDRAGYLWVGTTAGVSVFDGQQFRPWPRRGALPSPNPVVYALAAARDGAVWIGFGGPSRVARDVDGQVTIYTSREGLPDGSIRALIVDHTGVVWAGSTNGLARFTAGRWDAATIPGLPPRVSVLDIAEDADGQLWLSTASGIFRISEGRREAAPVGHALPGTRDIQPSPGGMVAAFGDRLARIDTTTGRARLEAVSTERLTGPLSVAVDRRGRTWVGSDGEGIVILPPRAGQTPQRLTERDGLAGDLVRDLLEDRAGNMWVGTQAGLTRVTPATVTQRRVRPGARAENLTRLTAGTDGSLWVQSPDGLARFTRSGTTLYPQEAGVNLQTLSALSASGDTVWAATPSGHLVRGSTRGFQAVPWPRAPGEQSIRGIATDSRGTVWFYTGERLLRWASGVFNAVEIPASFKTATFRFLAVDSRDQLWIGADGLLGVRGDNGFRTYSQADGVPEGQLNGVHLDATGRLWLASDNGLATLQNGRFVTLTHEQGLPRDRIFFMVEEPRGVFWLGIGSGILRVEGSDLERALAGHPAAIRYRLFEESDGLKGTPITRGQASAQRATDGTVWFLTSNGLAVIDPARVPPAQPPSQTRIEEVVADGARHAATPDWTVRGHVSSLQVVFAALHLTSPSKVVFRHRLDGVDTDWILDGPSRQASYANLQPGTYRFLVASSGGDGLFSDPPVSWTFAVLPMWYQTRAFYVSLGGAALFLLWLGWRLHIAQIQRRFDVVLAERARVGREIHDTLLQSLVGMALQLDTLSDEAPQSPPGVLRGELVRLRRQVEHYIGEAQQSIWDLRTPASDISDFAEDLRTRAERAVEGTPIDLHFVTDGPAVPLPARIRQPVLRIAQEAIVNAVRHGHPTRLDVEVRYESNAARVIVADDGAGFDLEAPRNRGESHWGLSIMRERAEQLGARFTLTSTPGHGTRVELLTPPFEATA